MGYDVNRFESRVSDEFICPICHDVLEDPLVPPCGEHIFCGDCIKGWLTNGPTKAEPSCPNDRTPASVDSLKSPLRSFRNLLYGLNIRCSFSSCGQYVKLQNLDDHENMCIYNPANMEKEFSCPQNCGALIKVHNRDKHSCVAYLKKELKVFEQRATTDAERIHQLETENAKLAKKAQDERQRYEQMLLNLKNEVETKESLNAYYHRQLEESQDEIVRLKGQAALSNGNGLRSLSANGAINRNKTTPPKDALKQRLSLVDTAVLVDVQDEALFGQHDRFSNSKFYSSNSNINGTVRSNGSNEGRETPSVVKTVQNLFNKLPHLPIPRMVPPVPPPKPPKPNLSGLYSSSSTTLNEDNSGLAGPSGSNVSLVEPMEIIREMCKKQKILQVMSLVNRRHFYPANEYYKAVSTKRGAHSFALSYEIRLLEILESYINSESKILDIGSGLGFITVCLAQLAKFVVGVEHVKELFTKSREIVYKYYSDLSEQNRIYFVKDDGRYGLQRFAPYDVILIEPLVRTNIPDIILSQLKPNGCIIAVVKAETRITMYKITINERGKQVRQTLLDDHQYLAGHHKDYLCDIKNQEMSFLSKIKNF